jgi:thiosulfate reductase cytochrome b subunit
MFQINYPVWLRVEHWLNVLFITLLIRSGIEILGTHPKLYRRIDSKPGTEWAKFTRKTMPRDKLFDTLDEEESYSPVISLPGRKNLGMGRHWHFLSVIAWILTGLAYYCLLFVTGQYHRYIPYSWRIFPEAWNDILTYLSFNLPPLLPGEPLDAVQKLTYCVVIFGLAPLQILTGAAQSPAVEAHFPWFVRMFGGRQGARSLHFVGLMAFSAFIAIHLTMIGLWSWPQLNSLMIFGNRGGPGWAIAVSLAIIAAIVAIHVAVTVWSLRSPRSVQRVLGWIISRFRLGFLSPMASRQNWPEKLISPEHRVNGHPPDSQMYKIMAVHGFETWRLHIGGLVANPMTLSLADLHALGNKQNQRVQHNCVQGWSSIAKWGGVPLRDILDLVEPLPQARSICFLTMQDNIRDEPSAAGSGQFYEVLDMNLARHPQALLAYEMNGAPLPIKHGAPLRLRIENQVGFKMAKWIERIEFVSDDSGIGHGMGGWREDNVYYDKHVGV